MADKGPILAESELVWFPSVNGAKDKAVSFLVVRTNFDYVRDKAAPGAAFYLDDDIKGIRDIGLDRSEWDIDAALQDTRCETRNPLSSRVGVHGRESPAVTGV